MKRIIISITAIVFIACGLLAFSPPKMVDTDTMLLFYKDNIPMSVSYKVAEMQPVSYISRGKSITTEVQNLHITWTPKYELQLTVALDVNGQDFSGNFTINQLQLAQSGGVDGLQDIVNGWMEELASELSPKLGNANAVKGVIEQLEGAVFDMLSNMLNNEKGE